MGLKIIKTSKNPKRKTRKVKMRRNPKTKYRAFADGQSAWRTGKYIDKDNPYKNGTANYSIWQKGYIQAAQRPNLHFSQSIKLKLKYRRVKKNPIKRKRHETIITAFVINRGDRKTHKKAVRYYLAKEGNRFSRFRNEAKIFPGDAGKLEAKRILPYLPPNIERIQVESV